MSEPKRRMVGPGGWAVEVRTVDLLNGAGPVDYFYVTRHGKAVGGLSPNVKHAGLARTIEEVEARVPAEIRELLVPEIGGKHGPGSGTRRRARRAG